MKNIVVCIGNGLLSEAIINMLKNSGEFKPFRVLIQKKSNIANDCEALSADILLLDVSYASGTTTINGNIKIDGGNLEISTIAGGTNIDDSKITINSKVKFLKGTSLTDNGKILLNEAKNYNVTGTVTSFNDANGDIMLHLIPEGFSEVAYETIVKGNTVDYYFADVATGTYT